MPIVQLDGFFINFCMFETIADTDFSPHKPKQLNRTFPILIVSCIYSRFVFLKPLHIVYIKINNTHLFNTIFATKIPVIPWM